MLLAVGFAAAAPLLYFSPSRIVLEALDDAVRPRGGVLHVETVRRGLFEDVVIGGKLELGDGTALKAPEARVRRHVAGETELHVPEARVELRRDPLSAFTGFRALEAALPRGLSLGRVSVAYADRAVGQLAMHGLRRVPGARETSFTAEQVRWGPMLWSDIAFSVTAKSRALEVSLGSRATARYLASDGRAGEWLVQIPRQSFGPDPARITGTGSWIRPEDPAVAARGSFRFVLDHWPQPDWPEARALVGSTGSVAAAVVPSPDPNRLELERLKVETAYFPLDGAGTITLSETPEMRLEAKGRRACTELARVLPSSRYRELVAAYAGDGEDSVELSLRLTVSARDGLTPRFHWRLSAGCGLAAL